ncbi:MAG: hypothetical protein WCS88_03930 [Patescibacteria group bacterium]
MTYVFTWGNNAKRATMRGRLCRVVATSTRMGSVLVEFLDNGQREVVSRRAIRRSGPGQTGGIYFGGPLLSADIIPTEGTGRATMRDLLLLLLLDDLAMFLAGGQSAFPQVWLLLLSRGWRP